MCAHALQTCVQAQSVLSLPVPVGQGFSFSLGLLCFHSRWKPARLRHLLVAALFRGRIIVMYKIPSLLDGCMDTNSTSYTGSAS